MCPAVGPVFPPQASCGSCRFWDAHEGLGPLVCPQPIRGEHAVNLMGSEVPGRCAALLSCARLRPVLRLLVSVISRLSSHFLSSRGVALLGRAVPASPQRLFLWQAAGVE